MTPVPTEFESLLEFQRILSQLVLKEALGGLRDALAFKESWKSRLVEGEVRILLALLAVAVRLADITQLIVLAVPTEFGCTRRGYVSSRAGFMYLGTRWIPGI